MAVEEALTVLHEMAHLVVLVVAVEHRVLVGQHRHLDKDSVAAVVLMLALNMVVAVVAVQAQLE